MGKDLIFIHGWASDSSVWKYLVRDMDDKFRLHLIDLPQMSDIFSYRNSVLSLIETKEISEACLVGWSLGALVSMQVIEVIPEKITGVVMISGTGRFTNGGLYNTGLPHKDVLDMKQRFTQDPELTRLNFFKQMFSREEIKMGLDDKIMDEVLNGMRKWKLQEAFSGLDYLLECDMLMGLSRIDQPVLIMHGDRDRICPHKGAEYMHKRITNSRLFTIHGAGHIPFLTNPSLFNACLKEWLESSC